MTALLEKLFGANWKTTITAAGAAIFSTLTWLSTISYDQGPMALVIPVDYKPTVAWIAGASALVLWIYNGVVQKTKTVTGGSVQQTTNGNVAATGTQTLVDATVKATKQSGESLSPEQSRIASQL